MEDAALEAVHVRGVVFTEDGQRREVAFDVPASSAVADVLRAQGTAGLSLSDVVLTAGERVPRCSPSSLSECRGDDVHVRGCRHG